SLYHFIPGIEDIPEDGSPPESESPSYMLAINHPQAGAYQVRVTAPPITTTFAVYTLDSGEGYTFADHTAGPNGEPYVFNYDPTATTASKLIGHVIWQGRPSQPNTLQQLPITLTL